MSDQFPNLFSPLKVGPVTIPNRIVVPGHYPAMRDPDTLPGERNVGYWESKAKGGVGLICTGVWGVHRATQMVPSRMPNAEEKLKKAADTIKQHGTRFFVQLWHGGAAAASELTGNQPWSASAVPRTPGGPIPHAMTRDEIKEVIEAFAWTAAAVKKAGVDGVELHGAHGYLFNQFMSPAINHRDDEYGGDLEGRMRFTLEVIDAVRAAVGSDFVVGIRFNGDEFRPDGYTIEDMKVMAPMMANTGKLDYLNVSTGSLLTIAPMYFPLGHSVYLAAQIKEVVDLPVCCIGRINDPVQAEQILVERHADLVAMNRATICDPELPNKARDGRLEEIRKCMACSEGCWQNVSQNRHPRGITCAYNPTVGKETIPGWLDLIPAATPKRVMVIGGGPGGLETARVAAARGHQVSLWEKSDDLGGQTLLAAVAPGRGDIGELARYYRYQMKLNNVDVHLSAEVTEETVLAENPDVVVVATGSLQRIADEIPGADQANVVYVGDILSGKVEAGENVVVVDYQQHIQGLSTADFLAEAGKKVQVVTPNAYAGPSVENITRSAVMQRLYAAGVSFSPNTRVNQISGNKVTVANTLGGEERVIDGVDTVVLATGGVENNALFYALKGKVKELHAVGDCKGVRKILWAVNDGATLARMI
ncbi:MAG: FAD-dependent oxidoreductase [Dehalococcoidales bacterium]